MAGEGVDPEWLHGWLAARSLARGLPAPVGDRGGWRVDTASEAEAVRWVFPRMGPEVAVLVEMIRAPRRFVKVCAPPERLRAALPEGWTMPPTAHVMRATGASPVRPVPEGYRVTIATAERAGGTVSHARIMTAAGDVAASGHAAEMGGAFVYDRIATDPAHRRKGLGQVLMQTLHTTRRDPAAVELLVATDAGRALYATLGWEVLSDNVTGVREG
ncbi:GNAT family N-acetyltransferase [Novosphingobium huizhouense]|uniref:GNAT family N-acetyltransferase n=1 Tax=Novosphingobium huizhouense TaxID=2866625 RepID=UPI001CD8C870|nr:GNAT family N-acetyltransferase [Novosphingobium huizhouense]